MIPSSGNTANDAGSGTAAEERLATRKPMPLTPSAGLTFIRTDDNNKKLGKTQKPPRAPRSDEPELLRRLKAVSSHSYTLPPKPMMP